MEEVLDVNISDFSIVHADDDFTIWKRDSEFDGIGISNTFPGKSYDFPTETCSADFSNYNWLLEYSNHFYTVGEGFKTDLYGPRDLEQYGITFTCRSK